MPCSKTRPRNRLIGRVGGDQSLTVAKWSKSELLGRGPNFLPCYPRNSEICRCQSNSFDKDL